MKTYIISLFLIAGLTFPAIIHAANTLKSKDDMQKSPYTGYTRDHWLEIAKQLIAGALPYVNPETGIFTLPESTGAYLPLEDFRKENQARIMERIMVGVIIYTAATGKDEVPGYKGSITKPFLKAITRGTDPGSDGYWGNPDIHLDFNKESFIFVNDYNTLDEVIEEVIRLDKNDEAYIEKLSKPWHNGIPYTDRSSQLLSFLGNIFEQEISEAKRTTVYGFVNTYRRKQETMGWLSNRKIMRLTIFNKEFELLVGTTK